MRFHGSKFPERKWTNPHWIVLGVLLSVVAGCEGDEQSSEFEVSSTDTSMVQPRAGTAAGTAAGGQPGARVINANLVEWDVELSETSVPPGEVSFQAVNSGTVEHALEVEGQGIEEETEHLQPGGTGSLSVNLQPGTYEVYCPVVTDGVSHREQGMTATLVVQ